MPRRQIRLVVKILLRNAKTVNSSRAKTSVRQQPHLTNSSTKIAQYTTAACAQQPMVPKRSAPRRKARVHKVSANKCASITAISVFYSSNSPPNVSNTPTILGNPLCHTSSAKENAMPTIRRARAIRQSQNALKTKTAQPLNPSAKMANASKIARSSTSHVKASLAQRARAIAASASPMK